VGYVATTVGGFLLILVLGLILYTLSNSFVVLILLLVALVAWVYVWPRLWRRIVLPRLQRGQLL